MYCGPVHGKNTSFASLVSRGAGHCSSVCQGLITQPDPGQDKPVSASVRNYFVVCRKVIMISQEGQASRLSHKILIKF